MRLGARTTAGAQTASEASPRKNRRRGMAREPIVRNLHALAGEYTPQLYSTNASTNRRRTGLDLLTSPSPSSSSIAGLRGLPKSGSAPDLRATCGFVAETRSPRFAWSEEPQDDAAR